MRTWWGHHLRVKVLAVGIILSILPLAIYGGYGLTAARTAALGIVQTQNRAAAEVVAQDLSQFVTLVMDQLQLLARAEGSGLLTAPREVQERVLYAVLRGVRPLEEVALVGATGGEVLSIARREVGVGQALRTYAGTPLWERIAQERPFIGEVSFDATGRPLITLAVPLPAHSGALVARTTLRGLVEGITAAQGYGATRIHVLDSDGRLIGGSDFSLVLAGLRMSLPVDGQAYRSVTGEEAYGFTTAVPDLPWHVVGETTASEGMQPVRQLAWQLVLNGLLLMALTVVLSILFGLGLTIPLEQLEAGARRIGAGDLRFRIAQQGRDELGRLVTAFNAMTERLQAQDASLRAERDRLDTIVSAIGAGMALVDGAGRIIWTNRRLATWSDRPLEGLSLAALLGAEQAPADLGGATQECAVAWGGRERLIRYHGYPLAAGLPGEPRFLAVLEDVTERRAMEQMVLQSEKLAAVGQMAAGVAHEINNPLAVISACAEELAERMVEEGPARLVATGDLDEYLLELQEQVQRCKGITSNLLDFARQGSSQPEPIDLALVVQGIARLVGPRARQVGVRVELLITQGLPPVWANRDLLQQVFLNLITNGLDAIAEGGGSLVQITAEVQGELLLVTVRDDGPGMAPHQLERALEPFFTTKPPGKGTGLGLSVCYGIIAQLGGDLWVESALGKGSSVRFTLPLTDADEPREES